MRVHQPLDALLSSQTAVRLLRVLARYPTRPFTGRELAQMSKTPPHRASQTLRRLEAEGFVTSRVVGRAFEWRVREGHPLLPALRALFEGETVVAGQMLLQIHARLRRVSGVVAVLFGSAARREEGASSDLDLALIMDSKGGLARLEGPLEALRRDLQETYGTTLRPVVLTRAQYARRRSTPFVQALEREGMKLDFGPDNVPIEERWRGP